MTLAARADAAKLALMKMDQLPSLAFAAALALFATVYAIGAMGAWHSPACIIREYQDFIVGLLQFAGAIVAAVLLFGQLAQSRRQAGASLYPVFDARRREATDHLRRVNTIRLECRRFQLLLLAGVRDPVRGAGNVGELLASLQQCHDELTEFATRAGETPQSAARQAELSFVEACNEFFAVADGIMINGTVDFMRDQPERRQQFNERLIQFHDRLTAQWQTASDRLIAQIAGIDRLLLDIDAQISG